jgi:phage terminase large subunit-like protein
LERLILSKRTVIDNNEINRYCFRNVVLKTDHNNNVKPTKRIDKNKIDGVIAIIEALGIYLQTPHYNNEIITI